MRPKHRELTPDEARHLLRAGEAGYWSVTANPPVEHDVQTVMFVAGRLFLLPASKLSVKYVGVVPLPIEGREPLMKAAHSIKMDLDDDDLIYHMLKAEFERYGVSIDSLKPGADSEQDRRDAEVDRGHQTAEDAVDA